jgi:hypothetical protein
LAVLADVFFSSPSVGATAAAASELAASRSSSISSNWPIVRSIFSDDRPNCWRRSRAIWSFSFSISSACTMSPAFAVASSLSRAVRASRSAAISAACDMMIRRSSPTLLGRFAGSIRMAES